MRNAPGHQRRTHHSAARQTFFAMRQLLCDDDCPCGGSQPNFNPIFGECGSADGAGFPGPMK